MIFHVSCRMNKSDVDDIRKRLHCDVIQDHSKYDRNTANRTQVLIIDSKLSPQQSTNNSQSLNARVMPADEIITREEKRKELKRTNQQRYCEKLRSNNLARARQSTSQQQNGQEILIEEKGTQESTKKSLQRNRAVLRNKSTQSTIQQCLSHARQSMSTSQEQIVQEIIDNEKRRKELQNARVQRLREKHQKARQNTTASEEQKASEVLTRRKRKKELQKEHYLQFPKQQLNERQSTIISQDEIEQKNLEREKRTKDLSRERQRRYREKHRKSTVTLQAQNAEKMSILDKEKRKNDLNRERQQRFRKKRRKSTSNSQEQNAQRILDRDKKKKELQKKRQQKYRDKLRNNFIELQKEFRQRLLLKQNATTLQVQNKQELEEVKIEIFDEPTYQDISTTIIHIKEESKNENAFVLSNNTETIDTECILSTMELTEERPTEIVENDTIIEIKHESIEEPLPTIRQDFVFVACTDTIAVSEAELNEQNLITNTDVCIPSVRDQEIVEDACPYCGKSVQQLNKHKLTCDWKFIYNCTFCPMVLTRRCNIKRHLSMKHLYELEGTSKTLREVYEEIVAKPTELNITMPKERHKLIVELMNANNIAHMKVHEQISIMTDNQQELIIPDPIENHQDSTADTQISNVPFFPPSQTFKIPTIEEVENSKIDSTAATTGQQLIYVDSGQKENVPIVFEKTNEKIDAPIDVNMQNQSVSTKKTKVGKHYVKKYIYCNECVYKTHCKAHLREHFMENHSDKVNLKFHRCVKTFQDQKLLQIHTDNLNVKYQYPCVFCKKIFMCQQNTVEHFLSLHSKEVENKKADEILALIEANKKVIKISNKNTEDIQNTNVDPCHNLKDAFVVLEKINLPIYDKLQNKPVNTQKKDVEIKKYNYVHCNECIYKSTKKTHLLDHIIRVHPDKLNVKIDEMKHLLMTRKKVFKRSISNNRQGNVNSKSKIVIAKSEYLCDQCSYKTSKKSNLLCHINGPHSTKLNSQSQRSKNECKARFKHMCLFCFNSYFYLGNMKKHIMQQHTSELLKKSIHNIIKEVIVKRIPVQDFKISKQTKSKHVDIDPRKINTSTLEYIFVYCFKCKNVKASFSKVGHRLKNCEECGTRMIYLCSKCKEMHTLQFDLLVKHWKQCTKNYEFSQLTLDKLEVYSCPECLYVGTHKYKFESHLARFKHNTEENKNNKNYDEEIDVYAEAKFAVQRCVTDFKTMTRRYCPKCDKIVTEDMQERKYATKGSCKVCESYFHFQCVKCNVNIKSHVQMRYHLNSRCFHGDYKCTKCIKRTQNWQVMRKHYMINHTNRKELHLCEFCSFRSKHRTNFFQHLKSMHPDQSMHIVPGNIKLKQRDIDYVCDLCNFTSKHKCSIKVHLQTVHGKKNYKCKICKFRTKYEANLKRHYFIRHKNYY
ncbi:uncharacterized protein LOC131669956 isoform X2 [Phymastichus coffea]|uniref:uncharacterized protein LOC131669956 isoform X2 n=1 Tax=Phymastichus coffea TaxID=108790 RepID=UPI00273B1E42|nr:uncharacterized protein LOC131669956 isoform X2 [Phymastichus coffea]